MAFYNIPKDVIAKFKRRFEESEKIAFPQLTEAEKYGIYKFIFEWIRINNILGKKEDCRREFQSED